MNGIASSSIEGIFSSLVAVGHGLQARIDISEHTLQGVFGNVYPVLFSFLIAAGRGECVRKCLSDPSSISCDRRFRQQWAVSSDVGFFGTRQR